MNRPEVSLDESNVLLIQSESYKQLVACGSVSSSTDDESDDNHNYDDDDQIFCNLPKRKSILHKQAHITLPCTLIAYVILQYFSYYDQSICHTSLKIEDWVHITNIVITIFYGIHGIYTLFKIYYAMKLNHKEAVAAHCSSLTITAIAGSSASLTLNDDFWKSCRDAFGVFSRSPQWPEWITSVPLMLLVAVSCDSSKKQLSTMDGVIVFLMIMTISCGYLLNVEVAGQWTSVNVLLLLSSCSCFASVIYFAVVSESQLSAEIKKSSWFRDRNDSLTTLTKSRNEPSTEKAILQAKQRKQVIDNQHNQLQLILKKRNLALVCLLGMPLFPIIYFLAFFKIIDDNWTTALFMIAGVLVKSGANFLLTSDHVIAFSLLGEDWLKVTTAVTQLQHTLCDQLKHLNFATNRYYRTRFAYRDPNNIESVPLLGHPLVPANNRTCSSTLFSSKSSVELDNTSNRARSLSNGYDIGRGR